MTPFHLETMAEDNDLAREEKLAMILYNPRFIRSPSPPASRVDAQWSIYSEDITRLYREGKSEHQILRYLEYTHGFEPL